MQRTAAAEYRVFCLGIAYIVHLHHPYIESLLTLICIVQSVLNALVHTTYHPCIVSCKLLSNIKKDVDDVDSVQDDPWRKISFALWIDWLIYIIMHDRKLCIAWPDCL